MQDDNEQQADAREPLSFPSEAELLAKGYVPINFSRLPDIATLTTEAGHPFPTHAELIKAGYVPISRRIGRLQGRPKVGQMYWVDFPHDAYSPEFVGEHPGVIMRASKALHDTCVVLPVSSTEQKAGTHFHELSVNPNPRGQRDGIIAYVVCDHFYTVHVSRLRPLVAVRGGQPIFPRVDPTDMDAICTIVKEVLEPAFSFASSATASPAGPAPAPAPAKPLGPNTLSLRTK